MLLVVGENSRTKNHPHEIDPDDCDPTSRSLTASTILGTPADPPLAMVMTASRTALTNSMIWAPWFTMNVTMSMIPLTARTNAEAGLRREMIQVIPAMMTVGIR
ncbi:hypothetical protein ACFQ2K_04900 [Streptomyces sanglieri]|uniref:Uncharacterized protein n=1 Tax=Streptomyces sanglieri TaxID=193460 RepID=A0ABW2WMZ6_9ACTN